MIQQLSKLALVALLPLAGCTGTKPLAKDPGLYIGGNEVAVKVKDGWLSAKTISMGNYATTSRTNGVAANTPAKQLKNVSDAFYFTVKAPQEQYAVQWLGTPRITFSNRQLPAFLNALPGDAPLWYATVGASALEPLKSWELLLKRNITFLELNDNKQVGVLRAASEEIKVTAHNRFGIKNSTEKPCYEFQLKGIPIAAVMPGEAPRAWMHPKTDAALQHALAGAMLAILFR